MPRLPTMHRRLHRDEMYEPQVAFHNALQNRMRDLLVASVPPPEDEILDVLDQLETRLLEMDEQQPPTTSNASSLADVHATVDEGTQTCEPHISAPELHAHGHLIQEEAKRRREWYENYVGWMLYYASVRSRT